MVEHSKPVRLASAALHAAMSRDWPKATRYVQRISDECGGEGLMVALRGWIDTYADHATDGDLSSHPARISLINASTGEAATVAESGAPPRIQWATRLIHARCVMSHDKFVEILNELPDDARVRGEFIGAVLEAVATTMNGLPRGFARMGRSSRADG